MKPLHTISGTGAPSEMVIAQLCRLASRAFQGLRFRLVDTVIATSMTQQKVVTAGPPAMQVLYHVTLIFEADSEREIDLFELNAKKDPELRGLVPEPEPMRPV